MKKILVLIIVANVAILSAVKAQQNVQFSQYMYNTLSVNPAYAGSRGSLNTSVLGRFQWVGIEGAPKTQTFFVHSPLPKENMGVGFSVTNDKIGPLNNTFIVGTYSYTVKLSAKDKLSFGASAGLNAMQLKASGLTLNETSDASFANAQVSKLNPNFGFGAYFHNDNFYTGFSTPKILQNKIAGSNTDAKEQRHFYWICGGIFPLNDLWKFKPTTMVKITKNSPISIDISANFLYSERVWMGLAHRIKDSFCVLFGYKVTDQLQMGYSYDYTTSKLRTFNSGSHEIFISYDFVFNKARLKSPRYF